MRKNPQKIKCCFCKRMGIPLRNKKWGLSVYCSNCFNRFLKIVVRSNLKLFIIDRYEQRPDDTKTN